MSAATEQNNGDVAVEKVAADAVDAAAAVKEDLKKPAAEKVKSADNGTKGEDEEDAAAPVKEHVKGTKRPAEDKKPNKDRRYTLAIEDLQPALADHGITMRKPPYFV